MSCSSVNPISEEIIIMNKIVIIVIASFLALSTASNIQPFGLLDEAKEQVEQLKSIVQGDIFVAHDDLNKLITELKSNQISVATSVGITMEKLYRYTILQQLDFMISLAQGAGFDVTPCTDVREETLHSLPSHYRGKISSCIGTIDEEAVKAAEDAKYIVDITMNKVHDLENQLNRCKEDILCISPLITQIELNKVRMPQNIKTEVQATESVFTLMRISVKDCGDSNLAGYTADSNNVLREIQDCIDDIMN